MRVFQGGQHQLISRCIAPRIAITTDSCPPHRLDLRANDLGHTAGFEPSR
jgi:hypothetical protein